MLEVIHRRLKEAASTVEKNLGGSEAPTAEGAVSAFGEALGDVGTLVREFRAELEDFLRKSESIDGKLEDCYDEWHIRHMRFYWEAVGKYRRLEDGDPQYMLLSRLVDAASPESDKRGSSLRGPPTSADLELLLLQASPRMRELGDVHSRGLQDAAGRPSGGAVERIGLGEYKLLLEETEKVRKKYESRLAELVSRREGDVVAAVEKHCDESMKAYIRLQAAQLMESLELQRRDLSRGHEIEKQAMRASLLSDYNSFFEKSKLTIKAVYDAAESVKRATDAVINHGDLLRVAYALKMNLSIVGTKDNRTVPLGSFVDRLDSLYEGAKFHGGTQRPSSLFPQEAREMGIYTEDELYARLEGVRKQCERAVFIGAGSPTALLRVLSFLHNALRLPERRSVSALTSPTTDPFEMYELLGAVKDSMRDRDLALCIGRLALLTGEPHRIASTWIHDATVSLKTMNATDFMLATLCSKYGTVGTGGT